MPVVVGAWCTQAARRFTELTTSGKSLLGMACHRWLQVSASGFGSGYLEGCFATAIYFQQVAVAHAKLHRETSRGHYK